MKIKTVTKIPFNDSDLLVVYEDDSGNEIQEQILYQLIQTIRIMHKSYNG